MWKKWFVLFVGVLFCSSCFAGETSHFREAHNEVDGWSVHVIDDDVDTVASMLAELDSTFAQLAAEDLIEVVSASASDITQTVTVTGINSAGNKVSESIALDTTAGTTAVSSTTTFRYIDQVSVDIECVGAITVRRDTGDTFITSIPIGQLEASMAQHFNGEYPSYITGWWAEATSTTGTLKFELRLYDDADCLDSGDGFRVLDSIDITNVVTSAPPHLFPQPIKCPAGSWISVFGKGGANNSDGSVTLQGFDSRR